jgi:hypothetical protein
MGYACAPGQGRKGMHTEFGTENVRLEDFGYDRIPLRWILQRYVMRIGGGGNRLKIISNSKVWQCQTFRSVATVLIKLIFQVAPGQVQFPTTDAKHSEITVAMLCDSLLPHRSNVISGDNFNLV